MKKKLIKTIIFIFMVLLAVVHSYYLSPLFSQDEIWIYGFGTNIVDGLVPYRDYNMVVTPFFPYLLSIIFSIFGKKLIIYHIVIAVMITTITYLASRKIKFYSLLIYVALLIYSINGYNTSTLFWLLLLLTILDKKDNKYSDILIPIIIGIMILTKQTMGLLIIPSLIYSKNRKKTFAVYLIISLVFFVYLITQNNLMQFLDYCLFGMFEFADKNRLSSPLLVGFQIAMCIILFMILIRSKWKRKDVFYVLMYQIMAVPILEIYHFVLGWSAFLYVVFSSEEIKDIVKNSLFIVLIIVEFSLVFTYNELFTIRDHIYFGNYQQENSFMNGRMLPKITKNYIYEIKNFVDEYPEHNVYIFANYSYMVKLELGIPINKFDLINNGNMGATGAEGYIEEIDTNCSGNKCLFIINDNELNREDYSQTNKDILKFVITRTNKIYSSSVFGVYIN